MAKEVDLALTLQSLDRQLVILEHEIRSLPKKIAELEKQLDSHKRRLEADQAALLGNQKEARDLIAANEDHRLKIAKLKKQTMQSTTQEQLNAFQHEIRYCETEIIKNEERVTFLNGQTATLEATVTQAESDLAAEAIGVDAQKAAAQALSDADRKKGVRIYKERQSLSKAADAKFIATYDRIRKKHKDGIVVADCTEGACSSCQMKVRPALLQQIRQSPETVHHCESCGRMFAYNPARSVDGIVTSAQPATT